MKQQALKRSLLLLLCLTLFISLSTVGVSAMSSEAPEYLVRDMYYQEVPFDVSLLESLDELASMGTESFLIDVRDLAYVNCYEILIRQVYEETVYGAIYVMDGSYYYLNYVNLGNQHFDAYGEFSYRSGEVMLTKADTYRAAIESNLLPLTEDYTYEYESEAIFSDDISTPLFWIGFVLLGFIAPIPFLILGFVLSRAKKLGCPRYWRIISYIAIIWLALAALLLLLFLIA